MCLSESKGLVRLGVLVDDGTPFGPDVVELYFIRADPDTDGSRGKGAFKFGLGAVENQTLHLPDRAHLVSLVAAKIVWSFQSHDQVGAFLWAHSCVRPRGVKSLRNQITEKCSMRDIKMYGESWNIRMSSSLEAWWWVLWINFVFTCKDGEEVPQINHYLQSQMVISWYGELGDFHSVLCSRHQDILLRLNISVECVKNSITNLLLSVETTVKYVGLWVSVLSKSRIIFNLSYICGAEYLQTSSVLEILQFTILQVSQMSKGWDGCIII